MSTRRRPAAPRSSSSGMTENEKKILGFIRSKQGMGATKYEITAGTSIQQAFVTKATTSLKKSKLIKEVSNKGGKHFLAVEFEPCKELQGGDWYVDGALDVSMIEDIKEICVNILERLERLKQKVVTLKASRDEYKLSRDQTKVILDNLVLDNVIMEVKSNGSSEHSALRIGEVWYKLIGKKSGGGEARDGAFASIPCGACPHIGLCTPDGAISPTTCVYYQKWLGI
ncbi:hypothetical protein YC2023_113552 [Brassica napus]